MAPDRRSLLADLPSAALQREQLVPLSRKRTSSPALLTAAMLKLDNLPCSPAAQALATKEPHDSTSTVHLPTIQEISILQRRSPAWVPGETQLNLAHRATPSFRSVAKLVDPDKLFSLPHRPRHKAPARQLSLPQLVDPVQGEQELRGRGQARLRARHCSPNASESKFSSPTENEPNGDRSNDSRSLGAASSSSTQAGSFTPLLAPVPRIEKDRHGTKHGTDTSAGAGAGAGAVCIQPVSSVPHGRSPGPGASVQPSSGAPGASATPARGRGDKKRAVSRGEEDEEIQNGPNLAPLGPPVAILAEGFAPLELPSSDDIDAVLDAICDDIIAGAEKGGDERPATEPGKLRRRPYMRHRTKSLCGVPGECEGGWVPPFVIADLCKQEYHEPAQQTTNPTNHHKPNGLGSVPQASAQVCESTDMEPTRQKRGRKVHIDDSAQGISAQGIKRRQTVRNEARAQAKEHQHEKCHNSSSDGTSIESAIACLRLHLVERFGSAKKAFRALDGNGNGDVSLTELATAFQSLSIHIEDIAGHHNLREIFKHLDVHGEGSLDYETMMGEVSEVTAEARDEWQMLTTAEKWNKWCTLTTPASLSGIRNPEWKDGAKWASLRMEHQEKHDREQVRMKKMMALGLHKTREGLRLLATHLPQDLDEEAVRRYRRDALEKVARKSRRIHQSLHDISGKRHVLRQCNEALREMERQRQQHNLQEIVRAKRQEGSVLGLGMMMGMADVNSFVEDNLPEKERAARAIARSIDMPIPDVEALQAHFEKFDHDGYGITRGDFPKVLESLKGRSFVQGLSDVHIGELWRSVDTDNNGRICLQEFAAWHKNTCGAVKLAHTHHLTKRATPVEKHVVKKSSLATIVSEPNSPKTPKVNRGHKWS
eukprot:gnl/TRDRNA2_/TRDRNA2_130890_c0_seq1.p1 gnl/TRDRNA2_/TRDRNA2_130890_c0~~gnl/TRDRNA2_/TRDRNA2_130890_c0_seq1.p1  ORF type:complete len:891 (-),score=118.53 gnl/TRDRNA2_/TRDRNA2_130890_c0_seq1:66-2708(-)